MVPDESQQQQWKEGPGPRTYLTNAINGGSVLTMRLARSALMTTRVPREKTQLTCRSNSAAQRSLATLLRVVANPSTASAALALLTSREYATANRYKPGGVVILGSQWPAMFQEERFVRDE